MGVGTAIGVGSIAAGGIGAAGSIIGSGEQASAANNAAGLQYLSGQNALNFQNQVWQQQQANQAPFIGAGQGAVTSLASLLGVNPTNPTINSSAPNLPSNVTGVPASNAVPFHNYPLGNVASQQTQTGQPGATPIVSGPATGVQNAGAAANEQTTPTNIGGVNYNLPTGGGNGFGSLTQPWNLQFQAPTAEQAAQTPGYQFALQQGEQALQNSAAAQGNIFSGGTLKSLDQYANNVASTNYQQAYNNALGQYQQAYNQFQNNQSNQFNRLASLAGLGQTSTAQLSNAGSNAANTASNTLLNTGAQIGQNLNNAGAARASGYTGLANSLGGTVNNIGTAIALNSLLGGNSGGVAGNGVYVPNIYTGQ